MSLDELGASQEAKSAAVDRQDVAFVTNEKTGTVKVVFPAMPAAGDPAAQAAWLTTVFGLNREHPIVNATREGLRGANGHVVFERRGAPDIRFEPASRLNAPARLVETLDWEKQPDDLESHGYKTEHARQIVHVTRMLCGASQALSDREDTASIVHTFLAGADLIEERTTHGTTAQRYEAAKALQRDSGGPGGRPHDAPNYLLDANTGEIVISVSDLSASARQQRGSSLQHGWLDARMQNLGWARITLDGRELSGRAGRRGPHLILNAYRGHLPQTGSEPVGHVGHGDTGDQGSVTK